MRILVILAKRYGCNERHTYLVGAASTPENAKKIKDLHEGYRGGKYECSIESVEVDDPTLLDESMLDYEGGGVPNDPITIVDAIQTQPEPMIATELCLRHYQCPFMESKGRDKPSFDNCTHGGLDSEIGAEFCDFISRDVVREMCPCSSWKKKEE
jgi:hypothetical protein